MGLFSSKKKVIVSSVTYNLAGDLAERPDWLKTTVAAGILGPGSMKRSMGNHIVGELFSGPSMRQRRFQQWSETRFPIGVPTATIVSSLVSSNVDFTNHIPVPAGSTAEPRAQAAESADFFYWAEQYLLENRYNDWLDEWTVDYFAADNELIIQFPDLTTDTINPVNYDPEGNYVYVHYTLVTPQGPDPDLREPRLWIYKIGDGIAEIDDSIDETNPGFEFYPFIPLRIKNKSIRDPFYTTTEPIFNDCKKAFRQAVGTHKNINDLLDQIEDNDKLDDIDYCFMVYGVPLNTQENSGKLYLYEFFKTLLPYQKWSKVDLDNWVDDNADRDIATLSDMESQPAVDPDPAIITFTGVLGETDVTVGNPYELVLDDGTRHDIELVSVSYDSPTDTTTWEVTPSALSFPAQAVTLREPAPLAVPDFDPEINTIRIHSAEDVTDAYDVKLSWITMDETVRAGTAKLGGKAGEVWVELGVATNFLRTLTDDATERNTIENLRITHQIDDSHYRILEIWGLIHRNNVYKSKAVYTNAREALDDEDESGFIVPMHAPTVSNMSLLRATEVAGHNAILVFNVYEVKKIKWYQTGFFKIILVVAMIAITVALSIAFGPAGGAGSVGILGTNLAVGTALGMSGLAAVIAGAIANALAALVLTMIITTVSTELFGDQIGVLIGALASFVALQVATNYQATGNLAINWGDMANAQNLLKLTSALAKGVQGYVAGEISDIQEDIEDLTADYNSQMDEIEKRTAELLGYGGTVIDPLMFLSEQDTSGFRVESSSSFLHRTLLTGSDIAEISQGMITDFPRLSLELPDYTAG